MLIHYLLYPSKEIVVILLHTLQYQVCSNKLFLDAGSTLNILHFTYKCNVQLILLLYHAKINSIQTDLHLHKAFTILE